MRSNQQVAQQNEAYIVTDIVTGGSVVVVVGVTVVVVGVIVVVVGVPVVVVGGRVTTGEVTAGELVAESLVAGVRPGEVCACAGITTVLITGLSQPSGNAAVIPAPASVPFNTLRRASIACWSSD